MAEVAELHANGAKRRYRVTGRQVEPGWWAYSAKKIGTELVGLPARLRGAAGQMLTRAHIAELAPQLPRCVQRARERHGGGTKVAWPSRALAERVAETVGGSAYRCQLSAPAIGEHWHVTSRKGRRRAY